MGALWLLSSRAYAASGDAEFLQARVAYDKKNAIALSEYVLQLATSKLHPCTLC